MPSGSFMGFTWHFNLHFRVNSLFHHLCSQCYAAQHSLCTIHVVMRQTKQFIQLAAVHHTFVPTYFLRMETRNKHSFKTKRSTHSVSNQNSSVPVVGEGVVGKLGCNNVLHMSACLQHSMESCFV